MTSNHPGLFIYPEGIKKFSRFDKTEVLGRGTAKQSGTFVLWCFKYKDPHESSHREHVVHSRFRDKCAALSRHTVVLFI